MSRKLRNTSFKSVVKWVAIGLGLILFLVPAALLLTLADPRIPSSFEKVKADHRSSEARLLDRQGRVLHEMRIDRQGRRLEWVELKAISPALLEAVIRAEDRRFYKHGGVDWPALAASALRVPFSKKSRGASTITMQTIGLLDKRLKPREGRRTWAQKWAQIRAARALERNWSKEQVLEAYLNLVSYRSELQGIAAASRGLFDKTPDGLTETESLLLAALITAPNASIETVVQQAVRLGRSQSANVPSRDLKTLAEENLRLPYRIRPAIALAPQAARRLLKAGEASCRSTLDGRLQRAALETMARHLEGLKASRVFDGAVLILENRTGEVLAYVGNSGPAASAPWTDGVLARRQAGSTLKPFLYALAIERGLLTSASLLDDTPLQVPTATGLYVPQNYDRLFRGTVTVRTALSSSINIPAVRTLLLVGLEPFLTRLKDLGFESLAEDEDYYGYSLALGSAEVTLWELANAYRTLANQGGWSIPTLRPEEATGKAVPVMDPRAAAIVADILADREARRTTFGLESPLATRFWTAVKTGTSKDMRDNWCLGFSEDYTVGVWVGNFSGEPMRNVSGVSGAAPIWLDLMNLLHARRPSRPPRAPAGVVRAEVSFQPELEPRRADWFIQGRQPVAPVRRDTLHERPRIVYPPPETQFRLDPEIPEGRQRVPLRFQPETAQGEWVLNERKTGVTEPLWLWKPERGSHVLSIVDRENRVLDQVSFSVK
ncbi:MAG: penicillin-binding protein 1C [Deltaproteobacteria bacterium]|nr:penicillin-binding protein 1C [Deltaproteobacteria bacterium]